MTKVTALRFCRQRSLIFPRFLLLKKKKRHGLHGVSKLRTVLTMVDLCT